MTPSPQERELVGRCLLEQGVLIGSVDEVWTHPNASRALRTLRMCVDAIAELVRGGHGVKASYVKAVVMQTDGLSDFPFALDEVAEFLVEDGRARAYWDVRVPDRRRFPHRCPRCGAAAFVGFNLVDCKAGCRP